MHAELLVLRLVHVLGAILWVGSGMLMVFFLGPALQSAGPAAGAVMAGLQRRKMMTVLPIVAILTILSGARLMQITSSGFSAAYFATGAGKTYAWAGLAGILAFLVGIIVNRPIMMRMARLNQQAGADPAAREAIAPELKKLQQRAAVAGMVATVLLLGAAAGMAVARYV
jgi:uncharacterized membrane protein